MRTETVCTLCKGESWTEKVIGNEVVPFRCECFKRKLDIAFLGAELAKAPHRRSALYRMELDPETQELVGDRTEDDLFIKGTWDEVAPHLRWAVGAKHNDAAAFTFKMVTDAFLLRVYLGDFSYKMRAQDVRDEITTYNNLEDLIADCSLLIVRLGKLGHNNRAAGNVLLEALNTRAAESKPTWLIEGTVPFGEGHKFYNYDVGKYIDNNFDVINVGGDIEAARKAEAELRALQSLSMDAEESTPLPAPQTQERYFAELGAYEKPRASKSSWKSEKKRENRRGPEGCDAI